MTLQTRSRDLKDIMICILWICLFVGLSYLSLNPKLYMSETHRMPSDSASPESNAQTMFVKN